MSQDIVIHRCKWFGKDLPIATALKNEEATILSAMPRPMRAIMSTKRIALLKDYYYFRSLWLKPLAQGVSAQNCLELQS